MNNIKIRIIIFFLFIALFVNILKSEEIRIQTQYLYNATLTAVSNINFANLYKLDKSATFCDSSSAVTYLLNGGRFGDHIMTYMHAKYISHIYKIPLLYKPFLFSDQLMLHLYEEHFSQAKKNFRNVVELRRDMFLEIDRNSNTLYVIPYFAESLEEHKVPEPGINRANCGNRFFFPYFNTGWKDKSFVEELRQLIRPLKSLNLVIPEQKENTLNVAMHVRKNSNGYDLPLLDDLDDENKYDKNQIYVDTVFPLKHAPDRYYIEQLNKLSSMFPEKKLYVFIFTDDVCPEKIVNKFEKEVNNPKIIFDYRKTKNDHCSNILEDFFSMTQFNYFIRNDSNLSIAASKLGKYKVVMHPVHHKWIGRKLYIDQVNIDMETI